MIDSLAARGDVAGARRHRQQPGSPDAAVRRAAISALGRMGDACVRRPVSRALWITRRTPKNAAPSNRP